MEVEDERSQTASGAGRRIALRVLYWLAVLIVSIAILVGLILLLESRDSSSVNGARGPTSAVST